MSAAAPRIPQAFIDQLAIGGRLLIPVGEADQQVLQLVQRNADGPPLCARSKAAALFR